jgi:glycosyltransferase involved in cell wall biosynthesis
MRPGDGEGPMRLLILSSYYLPEINAQSVRISIMSRRFYQNNKNIEIKIAVFNPGYRVSLENAGKKMPLEGSPEVIRYLRRLIPASAFQPQSLNPLLLAFWIYIAMKEIRGFNPDVVLATTPPFTPTIALYSASRICRKRFEYVVDYRDDLSSVIDRMAEQRKFYIKYPLMIANKLMSVLLFRSIKRAALVSTVNESLLKELQKENDNVLLVPNGLDLNELGEIAVNFDRNRVLAKNGIVDANSRAISYLGDLDMPYYMPEAILEPLKHLQDEGYNLVYVIIGDGKRRDIIEKKAKEMGIQGSVYLMGRKNHKDAMELLMASDVAFHTLQKSDPQAKHAIATKVYEYLGCKLPILVVADKSSAVSELVSENGVGLSVGWDELDRMESALRSILDHPEVYRNNLEKRYQEFLDRFDRNKGIDRLYERIKALGLQ